MKRSYCQFINLLLLLAFTPRLGAEDVYNEDYYWAQNLTETWTLLDYDDQIVSFADKYGSAIYQILVLDPEKNDDALSLTNSIGESLGAQPETIPFFFNGHGAALSEAVWTVGENEVQGYIVSIDDRPQLAEAGHYPYDYVLIAFSHADKFDIYHDFLMSNLDGFAPQIDEYKAPGVLSQFIRVTGGSILRPFAAIALNNPDPSRSPDPSSPGGIGEQAPKVLTSPGGIGEQAPKVLTSPGGIGEQAPKVLTSPMQELVLPQVIDADVEAAYAIIQREARILNQFADAPPEIKTAAGAATTRCSTKTVGTICEKLRRP